MSILWSIAADGGGNMGTPFFLELKKQASGFFKEKIRTARLALTDVTPAQLLAEEATNGNPWSPDTRTMGLISRAAFELDNYWGIVDVVHTRLARFDRKCWRESYKALILLEHLLTHGPASVAEEFQSDRDCIEKLQSFQLVDERGFNWGLAAKKKSERVLKLLEKGPLLKEARDRARKLTRGIEGFGSFTQGTASPGDAPPAFNPYGRSNSHHTTGKDTSPEDDKEENSTSAAGPAQDQFCVRGDHHETLKEIGISQKTLTPKETAVFPGGAPPEESKPLLSCGTDGQAEVEREDHPFSCALHQPSKSLLLSGN